MSEKQQSIFESNEFKNQFKNKEKGFRNINYLVNILTNSSLVFNLKELQCFLKKYKFSEWDQREVKLSLFKRNINYGGSEIIICKEIVLEAILNGNFAKEMRWDSFDILIDNIPKIKDKITFRIVEDYIHNSFYLIYNEIDRLDKIKEIIKEVKKVDKEKFDELFEEFVNEKIRDKQSQKEIRRAKYQPKNRAVESRKKFLVKKSILEGEYIFGRVISTFTAKDLLKEVEELYNSDHFYNSIEENNEILKATDINLFEKAKELKTKAQIKKFLEEEKTKFEKIKDYIIEKEKSGQAMIRNYGHSFFKTGVVVNRLNKIISKIK